MSFLFQPKLFCIFVLKIMVSYAKPDTTKACSQEKEAVGAGSGTRRQI